MHREPRWRELDRLASRAVAAAEAIDAIRGGDRAWHWYFKQVGRLKNAGRENNPKALRPVVEALEDRLAQERDREQQEQEGVR